jgi:diguanylate cyclase (GGDEF)-like protein
MKIFGAVARPTIRNERELVRYVALVTAFALAFALAVDVVNQLAFFVDWARCLWSWSVTTAVCLIVATPIAYSIGHSHLELFRAKELADELGRTDLLTGLSNRRALIEDAESSLAEVLALVIFDIDRFKSVNDAYGHLVGDATLRAVGRMMQEELGAIGLVARIGGEEFALLTSRASLEEMVERLLAFRDRLRATPILIDDVALRVTVSAGIALRENGDGFDRLYGLADRALYEAKAAGRNQFRFPPSLEPLVNRCAARFEPGSRIATLRSA